MLYVISGGSFNLATLDSVKPCVPPIRRRPTETTRQFIERAMRENHGYTVPEEWLADLDAIPDGDTGEPESGWVVGVDTPTAHEAALLQKLAKERREHQSSQLRGHFPHSNTPKINQFIGGIRLRTSAAGTNVPCSPWSTKAHIGANP